MSTLLLFMSLWAFAQKTDDCLICHEDPALASDKGKIVGLNAVGFKKSIHGEFDCTDCHRQSGNYDETPHYNFYKKVDCSVCHEEVIATFDESFHGKALKSGTPNSPSCASCHSSTGNPHEMQKLNIRSAENACRKCHSSETGKYDAGVHFEAAENGKNSPGCVSCHPTHTAALPPSTGAVNKLCENCHKGAMEQVKKGVHKQAVQSMGDIIACASCHDVHSTHKPHMDKGTLEACQNCHPGYSDMFKGSVHEPLLDNGKMSCLTCHKTHQIEGSVDSEQFGCGACHTQVEEHYRGSSHRLARLRGDKLAADCGDCHNGHKVLSPKNPDSPVNHVNIPNTCGKCHTDSVVVTSNFVKLPISLPNYLQSVHGTGWKEGKKTAVCSDCHGSHNLYNAGDTKSAINKRNIAATCGQCHQKEMINYNDSVHGKAMVLGIDDTPTCTGCHDEHLIMSVTDKIGTLNDPGANYCKECHEDPEMAARYGLPPEVVESYEDSYHGWAVKRGGKAVAKCVDCHNIHDIKSPLDPTSSIHKENVVATCGRCHPKSNAKFAASYTHVLARGKMMVHDYVKIIYIILIVGVLGGMALHNFIIWIHELKLHHGEMKRKKSVVRMTRNERIQHFILLFTFIGLAITGFALRFPDAWWTKILADIGLTEENRRLIHRTLAVIMVAASFFHIWFLFMTKRGRAQGKALIPVFKDVTDAFANLGYYLGLKKEKPVFSTFDYTQKAEYWALIWGTALMSITGFVLWFPALATSWLPAWMVRVCETIHFYEAILAVSAIVIWHWFFVIFIPREYPVSWVWLTGKMDYHEWKEQHSRDAGKKEPLPEIIEGE